MQITLLIIKYTKKIKVKMENIMIIECRLGWEMFNILYLMLSAQQKIKESIKLLIGSD